MFIERNGCDVAVGAAEAAVGVSTTSVGTGAVVGTAGVHELNNSIIKMTE
jgi:hypothetical protein